MKITESKLRKIIRSVIAENQESSLSPEQMDVVNAVVNLIKKSQNESVQEGALKDVGSFMMETGFRLFALKATTPMIATAIIMYCKSKGIEVDALTIAEAGKLVNAIGLEGHNALQLVINIIAGLGGAYGAAKGTSSLDKLKLN